MVTNCNDSLALIAVTFLITHKIRGEPSFLPSPTPTNTPLEIPYTRDHVYRMCSIHYVTFYCCSAHPLSQSHNSYVQRNRVVFLLFGTPYGQKS